MKTTILLATAKKWLKFCPTNIVKSSAHPLKIYQSSIQGYFKEVSIKTETIVATLKNAQGCEFAKKSKPGVSGCDSGLRFTTLVATLLQLLVS